jgi:hypothetical protein
MVVPYGPVEAARSVELESNVHARFIAPSETSVKVLEERDALKWWFEAVRHRAR